MIPRRAKHQAPSSYEVPFPPQQAQLIFHRQIGNCYAEKDTAVQKIKKW